MSEEKKKSLTSILALDPRLLSVADLCDMYEVFVTDQLRLIAQGARSSVYDGDFDVIISALRICLCENQQAEIDLGFPSPLLYGKEESE